MVVKEKRGRRRYVAFETSEESDTETVSHEIISSAVRLGVRPPKLIQFGGRRGIVRTLEPELEVTLELVNTAALPMRTLRTSGTLKTLRERYFVPDPLEKDEAKSRCRNRR
jgi:RNase P/RNase MRP subunit POP5